MNQQVVAQGAIEAPTPEPINSASECSYIGVFENGFLGIRPNGGIDDICDLVVFPAFVALQSQGVTKKYTENKKTGPYYFFGIHVFEYIFYLVAGTGLSFYLSKREFKRREREFKLRERELEARQRA